MGPLRQAAVEGHWMPPMRRPTTPAWRATPYRITHGAKYAVTATYSAFTRRSSMLRGSRTQASARGLVGGNRYKLSKGPFI